MTSKWEPLALLWAPSGYLMAPIGPLAFLWAPSGHLMAQIRGPRATKGRTRRCQEAIWEPSKNLNIPFVFNGFSTFEAPGGVERGSWVGLGSSRWGRKGYLGTLGGPPWRSLEAFGAPGQVSQVDLSKRRLRLSGTQARLEEDRT